MTTQDSLIPLSFSFHQDSDEAHSSFVFFGIYVVCTVSDVPGKFSLLCNSTELPEPLTQPSEIKDIVKEMLKCVIMGV